MNNDDTLISKLLSETCIESPNKDQPSAVNDLRNYFEKKLNEVDFISMSDYLIQHELKTSELTLVENTQCYRLVYKDSVLDFPANWSIFKSIKTSELIYLDQSLDQDFLLDIFSELRGSHANLVLAHEKLDQVVKVIYLKEEESKDHIQWFRGYFEKKNQNSEVVFEAILKAKEKDEAA